MKRLQRTLTGVLLLDKPAGITSNAALTRAKILYRAAKAGHTGTLDPFATGLLPICFGEAAKFAGHMLEADKSYEAALQLGVTTTTGDPEGGRTSEVTPNLQRAEVERVLQKFIGRIAQIPPMHSALKAQGVPLYKLARRGVTVDRAPREIMIHTLTLLSYHDPLVRFHVQCSKGTYIRVLAEDIGRTLGCGAMLASLRRTQTGGFMLDEAHTLDSLAALSDADREACLLPPDRLVAHLPALAVDATIGRLLRTGQPAPRMTVNPGPYRCYGPQGEFYGVVQAGPEGQLRAKRMMSPECASGG